MNKSIIDMSFAEFVEEQKKTMESLEAEQREQILKAKEQAWEFLTNIKDYVLKCKSFKRNILDLGTACDTALCYDDGTTFIISFRIPKTEDVLDTMEVIQLRKGKAENDSVFFSSNFFYSITVGDLKEDNPMNLTLENIKYFRTYFIKLLKYIKSNVLHS